MIKAYLDISLLLDFNIFETSAFKTCSFEMFSDKVSRSHFTVVIEAVLAQKKVHINSFAMSKYLLCSSFKLLKPRISRFRIKNLLREESLLKATSSKLLVSCRRFSKMSILVTILP